jgi:hypothetical protein
VIMPVSPEYRAAHPHGVEQYEEWKRLAAATGKAAGARVIDMDRAMPDDAFSDYVHLTPDAAAEWSTTLARELSSLDCGEQKP